MTTLRFWGGKALCLVLCLCCLLGLIQPVAVMAESAQSQFIQTALVHYRGYTGSSVIGQLADGTAVTVLEERGDFYKIDCYDSTGYIAKSQVTVKDGKHYVSCQADSPETGSMPCVSLSEALLLRAAILQLAQLQLGTRYSYGGMAPGGFDCSGFTGYVYQENGYTLNRCADAQLRDGIIVAKEGLQVGDLVFFRESWSGVLASHVGIYAGDGQIIHAKRTGICYSSLDSDWYARCFVGARRLVNVSSITGESTPAVAVANAASYCSGSGLRSVG